MSDKPWYKDGLRFECTGCGDCCTGAPGYVWVNKEEVAALAEAVGEESLENFKRAYVRKVGIRMSLNEFANGDCVFFDPEARNCTVYEARPRQCRTWPFWDSNIRSERAWKSTCAACPGSGQGPLYELDQIEELRKKIRI